MPRRRRSALTSASASGAKRGASSGGGQDARWLPTGTRRRGSRRSRPVRGRGYRGRPAPRRRGAGPGRCSSSRWTRGGPRLSAAASSRPSCAPATILAPPRSEGVRRLHLAARGGRGVGGPCGQGRQGAAGGAGGGRAASSRRFCRAQALARGFHRGSAGRGAQLASSPSRGMDPPSYQLSSGAAPPCCGSCPRPPRSASFPARVMAT